MTELISAQFKLQTHWFINVLEDTSDVECDRKIVDHANPAKWIAGHLLNSRLTVLTMLKGNHSGNNYQDLFGKGTLWNSEGAYPTIEAIIRHWKEAADELDLLLSGVREELWRSPAPFQTSIPDASMGGLIAYFSMHESYHLGQLSLIRRALGKPAMFMGKARL